MVDSIQLTRQIAVKAIVTEHFKNQVGAEIKRNIDQVDVELQQLEFAAKRAIADLEKKVASNPQVRVEIDTIRAQAEAEKSRLMQGKVEMQTQHQSLIELPVGSVVTQFTVESPIEVKVGENIFQRLEGGEILVKDGVIQEIRL